MITIVNYGMGNLGSIQNMLKRINCQSIITFDKELIAKADKIILPGVGSFDAAMKKIHDLELTQILVQKARIDQIPFLGICLGMQLLTLSSEEGQSGGLGLIDAETVKFKFEENTYKVPHMGWNKVFCSTSHILSSRIGEDARFYFVHSYYVKVKESRNSLLKSRYGNIEFDSGIVNENVLGVQFHPEKSHKYGMLLLENFARM